ncbi:MAG: FHA domain-containing protein [Deltaproteobacteria bacterium]|nr:FHA domain-containing protein [Deltaproteobacteria bacterium]
MALRLTIVETGDPSTEHVRTFAQQRVLVGRARSCDVCLPDMAVSTHHAEIRLQGTDYAASDLGSLNGTTVNGRPLVAHRPRVLRNGDVVQVAGFGILFRLGVATGPAERRDESLRQARELMGAILARTGKESVVRALVAVSGPGRASRFELPPPPAKVVVGRASSCGIRLDDPDVSREHAEIVVGTEGVLVRDLKSRNGVVMGKERVDAALLEPGSSFSVGSTTLALEHPSDQGLAAIFEAPEEETSSFALRPADLEREDAAALAAPAPRVLPPTGPADPLVDPSPPPGPRTTAEIPAPPVEHGGDLGLIAVGVIVVVAAVLALVYLFS